MATNDPRAQGASGRTASVCRQRSILRLMISGDHHRKWDYEAPGKREAFGNALKSMTVGLQVNGSSFELTTLFCIVKLQENSCGQRAGAQFAR